MKYRSSLDLSRAIYSQKKYDSDNLDFLPHDKKIVYGPSEEYLSIFKGVGNLEFNNDGTITPFLLSTRIRFYLTLVCIRQRIFTLKMIVFL